MPYQTGTRVKFSPAVGELLNGTIEAAGGLGICVVRADDGRAFLVSEAPLTLADPQSPLTREAVAAIIDRAAAERLAAGGEIAATFAERDNAQADLTAGTAPALVIARLTDGQYIAR